MTRHVPQLSLRDFTEGDPAARAAFSEALFAGLKDYGFIILTDHNVPLQLIARAYGLAERTFALPDAAKRRYAAGLRGYTPFGVEHAKDSGHPDLKEFWQIGREPSAEAPEPFPDNVWPDDVPEFRPAFQALYDALDETGRVRVGGSTYEYAYNAKKRLVAVSVDGVQSATYAYDWLGRRVARSTGVTSPVGVHYVFDREGRLLAEHSAFDGLPIREYVWLDDLPLAVIDGSGAVFYVHSGQLDEPLVMTDASKAKVWDAYLDPYGKAQVFAVAPAALELRLPGQWEQLETGGLFQNWHRDYDPSLGRYIEADPLGIEAGQNLYAYVDGNPLGRSDPTGLAYIDIPLPPPAAGIAGRIIFLSFRFSPFTLALSLRGDTPHSPTKTKTKQCPDDDVCQIRYEEEYSRCHVLRTQGQILRDDVPGCIGRAQDRLRLCIRNGFPAPDNQGGPYAWDPRRDGQRYRRIP